jgi:hypothetical protein
MAFPLSEFMSVWQRAQIATRPGFTEISRRLVPSAELLWVCGVQELEHITEEISVEWTKCKTLGAPSLPDLAIGIARSAFTEEEMAKLKTTLRLNDQRRSRIICIFRFCCAKPSVVIKGSIEVIAKTCTAAASLSMPSSSSSGLFDGNEASELSGQVLVFSISHDNERVKLYGHFAIIDEEKATFYRYPIASFVLNFEENQGRKRTHDFVREIYHKFYPAHLGSAMPWRKWRILEHCQ